MLLVDLVTSRVYTCVAIPAGKFVPRFCEGVGRCRQYLKGFPQGPKPAVTKAFKLNEEYKWCTQKQYRCAVGDQCTGLLGTYLADAHAFPSRDYTASAGGGVGSTRRTATLGAETAAA